MDHSVIQDALQEYKEGLGELERHLPEVARHYHAFTHACFTDGELSSQVKHLIGLALGVLTNDEYCILYHTKGAVDQGASDMQVMEAAAVSAAFGGGSAMAQAVTLVQDALQAFSGHTH
jgi:AhpD family alkylhydroperoxidase